MSLLGAAADSKLGLGLSEIKFVGVNTSPLLLMADSEFELAEADTLLRVVNAGLVNVDMSALVAESSTA